MYDVASGIKMCDRCGCLCHRNRVEDHFLSLGDEPNSHPFPSELLTTALDGALTALQHYGIRDVETYICADGAQRHLCPDCVEPGDEECVYVLMPPDPFDDDTSQSPEAAP